MKCKFESRRRQHEQACATEPAGNGELPGPKNTLLQVLRSQAGFPQYHALENQRLNSHAELQAYPRQELPIARQRPARPLANSSLGVQKLRYTATAACAAPRVTDRSFQTDELNRCPSHTGLLCRSTLGVAAEPGHDRTASARWSLSSSE